MDDVPVGQHLLGASATGSPVTPRRAAQSAQAAQPAPLAMAAGQALALQPAAPPFVSTSPGQVQVRDLRVGHGQTGGGLSPVHFSRFGASVRRTHSLEILEYASRFLFFFCMYIRRDVAWVRWLGGTSIGGQADHNRSKLMLT